MYFINFHNNKEVKTVSILPMRDRRTDHLPQSLFYPSGCVW